MEKMKSSQPLQGGIGSRWAVIIVVLIALSTISIVSAFIIGIFISTSDVEESGNIAHIMITGTILPDTDSGILASDSTSSEEAVKFIRKASENPDVKAILLEINSPGGTPVATYEIADAIGKANKTTVAWIREAGASGAYWIASSTDHIVANPMSMVGSIGVTASYLEFGGTLNRYNASYRRLVSGKYKDMGSPFKEMTDDEEMLMDEMLSDIKQEFVQAVMDGRKLSEESVTELAEGQVFTGRKALKLGLVDELGGKEEAIKWIEKKEGIEADIAEYKSPKTLADILTGVFSGTSFSMGEGMGSALLKQKKSGSAEIIT